MQESKTLARAAFTRAAGTGRSARAKKRYLLCAKNTTQVGEKHRGVMEKRWRESAVNAETPQNEQKRPKFARYGKRGEIIPLILQRCIRATRGITGRIEKMENIKLKPCPFCGSDVKTYTVGRGDVCRMIKCKNSKCDATMSFGNYSFNKPPRVTVEHYNKRAGEP